MIGGLEWKRKVKSRGCMSLSRSLGRNVEESQKGRWQGMERIFKVITYIYIHTREFYLITFHVLNYHAVCI